MTIPTHIAALMKLDEMREYNKRIKNGNIKKPTKFEEAFSAYFSLFAIIGCIAFAIYVIYFKLII